MTFSIAAEPISVIASELGLVDAEGVPLPALKRVIVFMSARPGESPWDYIQYDDEAVVIWVLDRLEQQDILKAVGIHAPRALVALLDFEEGNLSKQLVLSILEDGGELNGILARVAGGIQTVTTLPRGPLSLHGVRAKKPKKANGGPSRRPYQDLE